MKNAIIVGFGNIGNKRFNILKNKKIFKIIAVIDKKFNLKFKKKNNINYLKSYKDINLVSENIDLAFISTNPKNSYLISKFFIKNNINVFIEKPPCYKFNQYKDLLKLANKQKLLLKVGYNLIFDSSVQKIKNKIKELNFGKVYYVNGDYLYGTSKTNNNFVGSYMDVGIHLIYITLYLFGEIQTKYLYLDNNEIKNNIDDNGFLHLKTKNNISINLNFSLTHWENRFNYKIIFERGMIEICGLPKWSKQKLIISSRVYPSGKPKKKYLYSSIDKSFEKEMINLKNILEIKKNKLSIFNNKDFSVLQTMKNSLNKNLDNLSIKYFNEK